MIYNLPNDSLDFTRIQYTRFNGKGTRLLCGSEYQLKPCAITIFDLPEKELQSADVEQVRLTSKDWHNPVSLSKYAKHISSGVATLELEKGRWKVNLKTECVCLGYSRKQKIYPCVSVLLLLSVTPF